MQIKAAQARGKIKGKNAHTGCTKRCRKRNGDPWENRTPVYGVRGRRLDRLTNGPRKKEKSRHLPIFPGRLQPSIFGTTKLNYCVRNGNRWDHCVIGTGYEYANAKAISLALGYSLFFEGACTLKTEQKLLLANCRINKDVVKPSTD